MSEKHEYRKRFYDLEKEESWLNQMCAGGLVLKKVEWGIFADKYVFEPCTKKYVCRIDYNPEMEVLDEITSPYTMFVTGTYEAEFICCANGKLYFRKAEEKGDFPPIYTSLESRIAAEKKRFRGALPLIIFILIVSIYCGVVAAAAASEEGIRVKFSTMCFIFAILCAIPILAMWLRSILKIRSLKRLDENGNFPPAYTSDEISLDDAKNDFYAKIFCSVCWLICFLIYFISRLRELDFFDWSSKQFVSAFAAFIVIIVLQCGLAVYYLILAFRQRKKIKEIKKKLDEKGSNGLPPLQKNH